jgi:hypothetical protein
MIDRMFVLRLTVLMYNDNNNNKKKSMTKPFDCITNYRLKLIVQQPINLDLKYLFFTI